MIALFDIDSLIYRCKYKIEEDKIIQELAKVYDKERLENEIISASLHRLENMYMSILEEIEETGIVFTSHEFYLTTCNQSFRKNLCKDYKKSRERDELREKITQEFIKGMDNAFYSETHEADDLIANRIKELDESKYLIISQDKDVLKLQGIHYDYYRPTSKANEQPKPMRGLGYTSEQEHKYFLAYQMLVGDKADDIEGVKGIGDKKANKILKGKETNYELFRTVVKTYYQNNIPKERLLINYRLLKLGN